MRMLRCALWALTLLFCGQSLAVTWSIVYPRPLEDMDRRTDYPVKLLDLAMQKTGVQFRLVPSDRILLQGRALRQLMANREVNVVWSMTDQSREDDLLPIRIPIFKGLIGWRVFLINPNSENVFSQVKSLSDLLQLNAIQGHDWPDTKILQANNFEVITSLDYEDLFNMLSFGRADFFPRSVVEVWQEYEDYSQKEALAIEQRLGLRYPAAMYFFVNKKSSTLHKLIETGLERAIESGEFDALFFEAHKDLLEKARMNQRQFFELDNPILPKETPIQRAELWYQAGQE